MADGAPIAPGSGLGVATDEVATNLTGTVAKNGTITVTGTGTLFLSELSVGQIIRIPGTATEDRIVAAIATDLSLTVTVAFVNTASGQTGQRVQHVQYVKLMDATADSVAKIAGDAANGIDVDVTRLPALPAGTNNIGDIDVLTLPNVTLGAGDVDNDAVNTAKVVQVGGHASPQQTPPAAVSAAGDRVRAWLDLNGAVIARPRKLATYRAVYRLTTGGAHMLSFLTVGSTRKIAATIMHAATATKTVRLRSVQVFVQKSTVAVNFWMSLSRMTTTNAATGNPAITPAIADNADSAPEVTCLALPTTVPTEASLWSEVFYPLGVTAAVPTTNPPPVAQPVELLRLAAGDDEAKLPVIRAGVLEGWGVVLEADGASTVTFEVVIEFTEE